MEFFLEFLLDLILEGSTDLAKSEKTPKAFRIFLVLFLSLLVLAMVGGTVAIAIFLLLRNREEYDLVFGILLLLIGAVMSFAVARKIRMRFRALRGKREVRIVPLEPSDEKGIHLMSALATAILREHYDPILGKDQNDYMLEKFQSVTAIADHLSHGYRYNFLYEGAKPVGFFAFYPREEEMYLSKLYLEKSARGKGYSHRVLDYLIAETRAAGLPAIELNVNKHNDSSIAAYEKLGFLRIRAEKNDIGSGYYMDDYVYRLEVKQEPDREKEKKNDR